MNTSYDYSLRNGNFFLSKAHYCDCSESSVCTHRFRMNGMCCKYCARDERELSLQSRDTEADASEENTDGGMQQNIGQMEQRRSQAEEQVVQSVNCRSRCRALEEADTVSQLRIGRGDNYSMCLPPSTHGGNQTNKTKFIIFGKLAFCPFSRPLDKLQLIWGFNLPPPTHTVVN